MTDSKDEVIQVNLDELRKLTKSITEKYSGRNPTTSKASDIKTENYTTNNALFNKVLRQAKIANIKNKNKYGGIL